MILERFFPNPDGNTTWVYQRWREGRREQIIVHGSFDASLPTPDDPRWTGVTIGADRARETE